MRRLREMIRENAVLRFWLIQMGTFLLALCICWGGFWKALATVRQSTLNENQHLLRQGIVQVEDTLTNMYHLGMQIAYSDAIDVLTKTTPSRSTAYYRAMQEALKECVTSGTFYTPELTQKYFVYISSVDRILYNGDAYTQEVFRQYLNGWGVDEPDWLTDTISQSTFPWFCTTGSGSSFYIFPIMDSFQERLSGAVFFRLDDSFLMTKMPFLADFSSFSLMVYERNGQSPFFITDHLECLNQIDPGWRTESGAHSLDHKLVLSAESDSAMRQYLLIIPESEAMEALRHWQVLVICLLTCAFVLEALLAFLFSFRNGKPINQIAHALSEDHDYSTDLTVLNQRVSEELEEKRRDIPALQKSFFHDLMKGSFLSAEELSWRAKRAHLDLQNGTYVAVALRLFPHVARFEVDSQTVSAATSLQEAVKQRLRNGYHGKIWSYRHNVVVSLFLFELPDESSWDPLLEALAQCQEALERDLKVEACWGVGSPCSDLMQCWKSVEEANAMLEMDGVSSKIRLFIDVPSENDPYYLPFSVEETLVHGLRSGNIGEVNKALDAIQTENQYRRDLSPKQLQRLNRRVTGIVREQAARLNYDNLLIHLVNDLAIAHQDGIDNYFFQARYLCCQICKNVASEKAALRSEKIQAILQYIQAQYANPDLGLTLVGERFGISDAYLSTLFKAEIGSNFADYLEQIRIQAACDLLKDGVLVADVAEKTGYNSDGQDLWDAEFTRLTGITLNHVYIPSTEYNQRIDQQAATGTLPDLFDLGYTYYPGYAAKGLLADLTDLVHESGLYDAVDPELWDQVTIDGRIYGVPKEYPRGRATYVRKDWLDRLGMDVPETHEEFITMQERFQREIPECRVPYVAPDVVSSAYLPEFYQGAQTEIIPVNGIWVDGMMQPNMVTALENLQQAYQSGLLDQDVITASTAAARDAWNTGIVGCFCYWGGDWGQRLTENLQANVPEAEVLCIPPIDGAAYLYSRPTAHVISGNLSETQIAQIFWYFLYYIHDGGQGQTLFELGVEGVHWQQAGDHVEMLPSLSNPAITLPKAHALPTSRITPMKDESKTPEYSPSYLMSLKIVEDYALPQYFQPASAIYSRIASPLTEMRNDIIARIITGELEVAEGLELYRQYARDLGLYQALAEMNQ